eukprot:g208.t1
MVASLGSSWAAHVGRESHAGGRRPESELHSLAFPFLAKDMKRHLEAHSEVEEVFLVPGAKELELVVSFRSPQPAEKAVEVDRWSDSRDGPCGRGGGLRTHCEDPKGFKEQRQVPTCSPAQNVDSLRAEQLQRLRAMGQGSYVSTRPSAEELLIQQEVRQREELQEPDPSDLRVPARPVLDESTQKALQQLEGLQELQATASLAAFDVGDWASFARDVGGENVPKAAVARSKGARAKAKARAEVSLDAGAVPRDWSPTTSGAFGSISALETVGERYSADEDMGGSKKSSKAPQASAATGKPADAKERMLMPSGEDDLRSTDMFYKKTLCIWNEKGKCRNGDQCRFAHGVGELRLNQKLEPAQEKREKTEKALEAEKENPNKDGFHYRQRRQQRQYHWLAQDSSSSTQVVQGPDGPMPMKVLLNRTLVTATGEPMPSAPAPEPEPSAALAAATSLTATSLSMLNNNGAYDPLLEVELRKLRASVNALAMQCNHINQQINAEALVSQAALRQQLLHQQLAQARQAETSQVPWVPRAGATGMAALANINGLLCPPHL